MSCFEVADNRLRLFVKVQPGAQQSALAGVRNGALLIRLNAPPEGGKANRALIALLAKTLKTAKSEITITRGLSARHKSLTLPLDRRERLIETIAKL